MTDYEILSLAHRTCWKYKDGEKGQTYTFDKDTMLEFYRILKMMDEKCRVGEGKSAVN